MNNQIKIRYADYKKIMKECKDIVADRETNRECLTRVHLAAKDGMCTVSACDGYLARQFIIKCDGEGEFLLPIEKGIPRQDDESVVIISNEDHKTFVDIGNIVFKYSKPDEDYVDINKFHELGEPVFEIHFNPKLLQRSISSLTDKSIKLSFHGNNEPMLISTKNKGGCSLVMPMRWEANEE